jgi:uncharacterized LabA/DUF88 family protein
MRRYAFIDVQNTQSTAQKMLGFVIDWAKLCEYLKNSKSCSEVFLYTGIENGDNETVKEFDAVSKLPCCIVRSKAVFAYKNKDKTVALKCNKCGGENIHTIEMGYRKKSNCDVELSVDVIEKSDKGVEIYIFTGDGDFEYLIRKALDKGVEKVTIVSYALKENKVAVTFSRFSTKLRNLVAENGSKVVYMSLKDIQEKIKKDIPSA